MCGSYSRLLLKYFLAEGVMSGHSLLLASASENPEEVIKVSAKLAFHVLYVGSLFGEENYCCSLNCLI